MEVIIFILALAAALMAGYGAAARVMSKENQSGDSISEGKEFQRDFANFTIYTTTRLK